MDFSDYPKYHPCYDPTNKHRLGYFKDEMNGKVITELIGLIPKMYSSKIDEKSIQMMKQRKTGIPKKTLKRSLNFENYRKTLVDNESKKGMLNSIRSYQPQIFSITCNKQGLSSYDNKRFYFSNDESYPHGHYKINQLTTTHDG